MSSFKRKIEEQKLFEEAKGKVRLGLCCINNSLRNPVKQIGQKRKPEPIFNSRTTTRKCFNVDYAKELALQNIKDIIPILEWNQVHGIRHFRLTSNLFPHYTDTDTESYSMEFAKDLLKEAGDYANRLGHRITTHPGQYTQPASIHQNVRDKSIEDLVMHADILDAMGIDDNGILCIHGGGTYGKDKETAIRRWCDHFDDLPRKVKNRLCIENCEKSFSIEDCLEISEQCNIPVILDTHHYNCWCHYHPNDRQTSLDDLMQEIVESWGWRTPLFHISDQKEGAVVGAHHDYVQEIPTELIKPILEYDCEVHIEVEAKAKEDAVLYLMNKYSTLF